MWHGEVVWCHEVTEFKARPLTRRFRSSDLCGREELLLVQTLTFLTFGIFDMPGTFKHWRKGKKKKKAWKVSLKFVFAPNNHYPQLIWDSCQSQTKCVINQPHFSGSVWWRIWFDFDRSHRSDASSGVCCDHVFGVFLIKYKQGL